MKVFEGQQFVALHAVFGVFIIHTATNTFSILVLHKLIISAILIIIG